MVGRLTRFGALVILVFLLAALAHVWVESSPAQVSGHRCQFCLSGGWAIVSSGAGLDMTLRILRLEVQPPQLVAKHDRTEASAPRAPPQV